MLREKMRVLVKNLGEAVVTKVTRGGAVVALKSAGGLKISVPTHELESLEVDSWHDENENTLQPHLHSKKAEKLKALEALRFGLVPNTYLEDITLDYDRLKDWIISRLPHNCVDKACVYEVSGPFGTGKSHTMAVMRHLVRGEGYLSAKIEVDGENISLAYPGKLLYNLWLSLQGSNYKPDYPLLDLYLMAMQKGHDQVPAALEKSKIFKESFNFIRDLRRLDLVDEHAYLLEEALSGSDVVTAAQIKNEIGRGARIKRNKIKFKPFKARAVRERPRLFIESLLGHSLMAVAAGYKGLLITIDEFEVHSVLSPALGRKAQSIIDYLLKYVNGKTGLPSAPLVLCFATIGQDGYEGDSMIEDMIDNCGGQRYVLGPWSVEQRLKTAEQIYLLYRDVYEITAEFSPHLVRQVEELLDSKGFDDHDRVRAFIKWYMALLDVEFGPGRQRH